VLECKEQVSEVKDLARPFSIGLSIRVQEDMENGAKSSSRHSKDATRGRASVGLLMDLF